jgi:thiamine biosynthesis protein ThiS
MEIYINQEKKVIDGEMSINDLLLFLKIQNKYIAVEVNKTIIPKSEYKIFIVKNNDKIEIINAVGGG